MKKGITIGQLAKLMNVSTHQIRYFEKKGVLFPDLIDQNGYRIYGIKEIYILSHILLLRELDIPVSKIKELFRGDKDEYIEVMKKKAEDVESQIKRLEDLRNKINNIIKSSEIIENKDLNIRIEELDTRKLLKIDKFNKNHLLNAVDYYNHIDKLDIRFNNVLYELYDDNYCYVCVESEKNQDYILSKGKYLCSDINVDSLELAEKRISEFFQFAKSNNYKLTGKLIIIEDPKLSVFYNNSVYIKIQMKIKEIKNKNF